MGVLHRKEKTTRRYNAVCKCEDVPALFIMVLLFGDIFIISALGVGTGIGCVLLMVVIVPAGIMRVVIDGKTCRSNIGELSGFTAE